MRYIYDNWKHSPLETPYLYLLYRPNKAGKDMVDYYRHEIASFKRSLEEHFGVSITDEHLWQAIRISNETRRLQQRLYELRKRPNPPVTGAETIVVMVTGTAMPKEQYNVRLRELLDEIGDSEGHRDYVARVMIIGANLDDPFFPHLVEDQGGLVVVEQTCFGARMMWEVIDEEGSDPLGAIAEYYVSVRPSCPRSYGEYPKRVNLVREMVELFSVDGIIGERLASCDVCTGEHYMLKSDLKKAGIPFMSLEREYIPTFTGQLRTRIQAFLEGIRG
jgi:benzoyl-CoA reductase/2-hydroxyglutaryl-CoA dehydratase subunit BcrC/BadD/HgdB